VGFSRDGKTLVVTQHEPDQHAPRRKDALAVFRVEPAVYTADSRQREPPDAGGALCRAKALFKPNRDVFGDVGDRFWG
jgi:hypothetical protein